MKKVLSTILFLNLWVLSMAQNPLAVNCSCTNPNDISDNNGHVTAEASGGTMPYSYLWSDDQTTATATGLSEGTYTVTVMDAMGSTAMCSSILSRMSLTIQKVDESCFRDGNATAQPIPLGPGPSAGPYNFLWSDGSSPITSTNIGLSEGTYTVTITDKNGCQISESVDIGVDEDYFAVSIQVDQNAKCDEPGAATIIATGVNPPYTYTWPHIGQAANSLDDLEPGDYPVTVTDLVGCQRIASVTIIEEACRDLPTLSYGRLLFFFIIVLVVGLIGLRKIL